MPDARIHVIETGRLRGNKTFLRGKGFRSLLHQREDFEFPVYSFIVEHPEGLIAIDTGLSARARAPRPRLQRRFVPCPIEVEEIGPRMRGLALAPEEVSRVVLTHLDWDHAGGLAHFQRADVLVHREEWRFAQTLWGRQRYEPRLWPQRFRPALYDLDPEPYGPFPASKAITADGAVRVVPMPGHSIGQVGVVVQTGEVSVVLCADHVLRQDWFAEDYEAGRLVGLGAFYPKLAAETSRRLHRFISDVRAVLAPSHDDEMPDRLAHRAVTELAYRRAR